MVINVNHRCDSSLLASPSRHPKTMFITGKHLFLWKLFISQAKSMLKVGFPSKDSQKQRYLERKVVTLMFPSDLPTMAATSK